jgi:energy-coupling factor transporter transmembrane protein EcfT
MTVFMYRAGDTSLHRLDARCKLLILAALVLATLKAAPAALLPLLTIQLLLLKRPLGLSLRSSLYGLRFFLMFLISIILLRTLMSPVEARPVFLFLTASVPGLLDGFELAARMLAVVFFSVILIATTRPAEIKAAVEWVLTRVPGVPAVRIGTMLGLLLRFMPLIFQQAGETLDAQRARGVENRRNPIYRLRCFAMPFMRRTVVSADRLALAMSARGYRDLRTPPRLAAGGRDWILLAASLTFAGLLAAI